MEMRSNCEKCNTFISSEGIAYVCSYECTFCEPCTKEMIYICTNCSGELVRRPRRMKSLDEGS